MNSNHLLITKDDNKRRKKKISFNKVTVRDYEQIMESHPCVRNGPGLGIGWDYKVHEISLLDDYERKFLVKSERQKKYPILGAKERESILYNLGYTSEDMYNCVCEIHEIKDERLETSFEDSFLEIANDNRGSILKKSMSPKGFRFLPRSDSDPVLQLERKEIMCPKGFRFLPRSHSDPLLQSDRSLTSCFINRRGIKNEKSCSPPVSLSKMLSTFFYKPSIKIPKHMRSSLNKKNRCKSQ